MLPGFTQNHTIAGAVGALATVAIPVPGIKATNVLLALIRHKAAEAAAAVDTTDFTVADGTITAATINTTGYYLTVIYAHGS